MEEFNGFLAELQSPADLAIVRDVLRVRGWATSPVGAAQRAEVRINGEFIGLASCGMPRTDLGHLGEAAAQAGFAGDFNAVAELSQATHDLEVRLTFPDGGCLSYRRKFQRSTPTPAFPDGHFYSPVVNIDEVDRERARVWPHQPVIRGVDFRPEEQRRLLREAFARFAPTYDYPLDRLEDAPAHAFYHRNDSFGHLDPITLYVFLRAFAPRRMIEIGSGFSSLLTADVNQRHLGGELDFQCIEPYPRPFLLEGVPGIRALVQKRVQEVDSAVFESLASGDILFVDSSHVAKTGSDVNHIFFEILPRLAPGVIIHFHDIFFPADYCKGWVIGEGRSWNEQYLLHALLMDSAKYEVLFGNAYAHYYLREELREVLGERLTDGVSFWIRKAG